MKNLTPEINQKVKDTLKSLPKEKSWEHDDYFCTYELMVYKKEDSANQYDFSDFYYFKGIRQLEKTINDIINEYQDTLYCIDLKYSYKEGDFDQYTIYTHNK
jgi:hypothetical protein